MGQWGFPPWVLQIQLVHCCFPFLGGPEISKSMGSLIESYHKLSGVSQGCILFVCLFVCLLACLFVCLFACLLVCLFACFFVSLFVCLLACLLACLFVCLFVCLFACFFVSLFVCLVLFGDLEGGEISVVYLSMTSKLQLAPENAGPKRHVLPITMFHCFNCCLYQRELYRLQWLHSQKWMAGKCCGTSTCLEQLMRKRARDG